MITAKHILTIALLSGAIAASAQTTHEEKKTEFKKSISDDGKTLYIKISGTKDKKSFSFEHTYNIKGLRKMQVDSIKKHVTDSLGVN